MKTVDLDKERPSLEQLLALAEQENLILRAAGGREYVLAEVEDLAREISQVRNNAELMQLLAERSEERERIPLDEARRRLGLE